MAGGVRRRLPRRVGYLYHRALRHLHHLRGLYRPRVDRHGPAVQRDAEFAVDGLRSRDGRHAGTADEPIAAQLPAAMQAIGQRAGISAAGVRVSGGRLVVRGRTATDRVSVVTACAAAQRPAAGRAGAVHFQFHQTTGELRRCDEFCYLPDVFYLIGAVSAVEDAGGQRTAVPAVSL